MVAANPLLPGFVMSERERWIVYPLLFLALGAALRDKLAKQTRAKQIVCEQLYVVDSEGRPMAELTGDQLRFDLTGGDANGLVIANVVNAQALFQRGKPIAQAGEAPSWQQLLGLLQRMGLIRAVPAKPRPAPQLPQTQPPQTQPRQPAQNDPAATPPEAPAPPVAAEAQGV